MSDTPVFDETLKDHPPTMWMCAPIFPWPAHAPWCLFDGYNWHICTCPYVNAQIELLYGAHWRLDIPSSAG